MKLDVDNNRIIKIYAGINEDASYYTLDPKKTLLTPEFAMTYSTTGKGGVSRNFHRWARMYKLSHADSDSGYFINSWEGVYFKVAPGSYGPDDEGYVSIGRRIICDGRRLVR